MILFKLGVHRIPEVFLSVISSYFNHVVHAVYDGGVHGVYVRPRAYISTLARASDVARDHLRYLATFFAPVLYHVFQ